jgi:hypothetical protein
MMSGKITAYSEGKAVMSRIRHLVGGLDIVIRELGELLDIDQQLLIEEGYIDNNLHLLLNKNDLTELCTEMERMRQLYVDVMTANTDKK